MKIKELENGSLGEADILEFARLLIKAGYIVRITKEIIPGRVTKSTVIEYTEDLEKLHEVVQPHGNWRERIYTGGTSHYYCSECGFEIDMFVGGTYNYCPHCGAKMDETE